MSTPAMSVPSLVLSLMNCASDMGRVCVNRLYVLIEMVENG